MEECGFPFNQSDVNKYGDIISETTYTVLALVFQITRNDEKLCHTFIKINKHQNETIK